MPYAQQRSSTPASHEPRGCFGATLGLDPGVSYAWKGNSVSLNVPFAIHRVRVQNFADKLESEETGHFENGDAAFADWAIMFGFAKRF